ncbi:MAG: hypothetical protein IPK22_21625 [Verrucomicrobiaceae bacterium]|nr:hypothetical protein [Verrucomicrobiaceae bacterium]
MTSSGDRQLPIAIAGSLLVHALLFFLLALLFASPAKWDFKAAEVSAKPKEKEVTLIFPEQLIPPPPLPKPPVPPRKKEIYIRTTQNEASDEKPKNAAFISDRNTKASASKAPDPSATSPMPTTEGLKFQMNELANRDYRDGDIKDDAAKKASAAPKTPNTPPKPPTAATPASPPTPPAPAPKPPTPPTPPQPEPQSIASAADTSPLAKMMKDADQDLARLDMNRLPIEVRKPTPQMKEPDAPPPTPEKPQMREVADSPPVPKAIPVSDEVAKTTSKPEDKAFMPFTRTSENKGTISNRGTEDAVDAKETQEGKYIRHAKGIIERNWHRARALKRDDVTYGALSLRVYVDAKGKVKHVEIVDDKESNPFLTNMTIKAILTSQIPPMPEEVKSTLPTFSEGLLPFTYNVLIY